MQGCIYYIKSLLCVTLILYAYIRYLRAPKEFVIFHLSTLDTMRTNIFKSIAPWCLVYIRYLKAPREFIMLHLSTLDTMRINIFKSIVHWCLAQLNEYYNIILYNITIVNCSWFISLCLLFCEFFFLQSCCIFDCLLLNYIPRQSNKRSIYLFVLIICNTRYNVGVYNIH